MRLPSDSAILSFCKHGVLAQLGERYAGSVEVTGSSPVRSTMLKIKPVSAGFFILSVLSLGSEGISDILTLLVIKKKRGDEAMRVTLIASEKPEFFIRNYRICRSAVLFIILDDKTSKGPKRAFFYFLSKNIWYIKMIAKPMIIIITPVVIAGISNSYNIQI